MHDAAKFRKTQNTTEAYLKDRIREYGSVGAGHCSIYSWLFATAAELYGHIEGCVVQLLLQRAEKTMALEHIMMEPPCFSRPWE